MLSATHIISGFIAVNLVRFGMFHVFKRFFAKQSAYFGSFRRRVKFNDNR